MDSEASVIHTNPLEKLRVRDDGVASLREPPPAATLVTAVGLTTGVAATHSYVRRSGGNTAQGTIPIAQVLCGLFNNALATCFMQS